MNMKSFDIFDADARDPAICRIVAKTAQDAIDRAAAVIPRGSRVVAQQVMIVRPEDRPTADG